MVFSKPLLEGIRRGRIKCSVRFWTRPHVKAGGRYPLGDGQIVVDSIASIGMSEVTEDLARESGFGSLADLLAIARHGSGENIYLVRFHYLRPGAWDDRPGAGRAASAPDHQGTGKAPGSAPSLLQRIRVSTPPGAARKKAARAPRGSRPPGR